MPNDLNSHWRSAYENKYLGAWNLWKDGQYKTATVTIERITEEVIVGEKGRKSPATLLHFKGKRTPMILTRKQGKVLDSMFGPVKAGWVGKEITLWVEQRVRVQEGVADVLRIKNNKAAAAMREAIEAPSYDGGPEDFGGDDFAPLPEDKA